MPLSPKPIAYCGNVHPAGSLDELRRQLERVTLPVREQWGRTLGIGLWFPQSVAMELVADSSQVGILRDWLDRHGIRCTTLNAFPFGNFHADRVKDSVYQPNWSHPDRREYTIACAHILAELSSGEKSTSLSTVPLAFKQHDWDRELAKSHLLDTVEALEDLEETGGIRVRLGLEPEPFCALETVDEAIAWWDELRQGLPKKTRKRMERYLGVCLDLCHQAVEFEDLGETIDVWERAEIPIVKVQITSAIELANPREDAGRQALRPFIEPRYLHQTFARSTTTVAPEQSTGMPVGRILSVEDLTLDLVDNPPHEWRSAQAWRVHYHVPIHLDQLGPLGTTSHLIPAALRRIAQLSDPPDLEVETYTWNVWNKQPGRREDLVDGILAELRAVERMIEAISESCSDPPPE